MSQYPDVVESRQIAIDDVVLRNLFEGKVIHLSYSMISSYEYCPTKYYLEYVRRIRLRPEPIYFKKGKALHKAAQNLYSKPQSLRPTSNSIKGSWRGIKNSEDKIHLENALRLMVENRWSPDWEVVGIECPFMMAIHEDLPPYFGIIDLVLRKGNSYVVVDHKTGATFNDLDSLQLVFYREFIRKAYGSNRVASYFDQYRWVNNLQRIRKPAFARSKIEIGSSEVRKAVRRAKKAYTGMSAIAGAVDPVFSEKCYRCQNKQLCFNPL